MKVRRTLAATACALALFVVTANKAVAQTPGQLRQLVVPFENAGSEPRVYWLSEGSAVILTDDLIALGLPAIARDDRVRAFERLRVPVVAGLSHATVIRVGQVVGAAQVVVGSFELRGDDLVVKARTIRLDAGRMSPEIVERGPLSDLFAIYARVARRIAPESPVTAEQMEQGHPPLAAFEQYIKGVLAESPATKTSFLTGALQVAPTFQRARLALWSVYDEESDHQRALAIVREVPSEHRLARQARFLGAVSLLRLARYQEAYDILIDLNRAAADPALLNNLGVIQLRRSPAAGGIRAVTHFGDASRMDPGDSDLFFNLGYAYWFDRDIPSAIAWLREAVRRNPTDDQAHYVLGVALQAAGSSGEAAREKELAKRLSSEYAEWESKQPSSTPIPRGLERLKTEIDIPASLRLDSVIVATGQRDQQEVAAIHLEAARRLYKAERDAEAIAELRRTVYLSPYESEAHLLLGRLYLRDGRVQEAIDALKISIWSSDTIAAHLALAQAYVAAKDQAAARSELQGILKGDPANVEARTLLESVP